ncbi:MAG: hemin uptake protein HemP [Planctomycetales bacterium]|nr:hemin uptake protein HemP [Planctomycetales bacterium]
MNDSPNRPSPITSSQDGQLSGERVIASADLLGGRRMVWIQHNGEYYRLIETKNGKLLLQK